MYMKLLFITSALDNTFKFATQNKTDTVDFEVFQITLRDSISTFRGLISGNKEDFTKSIVYFTKSNDVFTKFCRLEN